MASKDTFFQESKKRNINDFSGGNKKALLRAKDVNYINWPLRLKYLIENENNNETKQFKDRHNEARLLSSSWVTCACGNQCAIIPRDTNGEPTDEDLSDLGYDFHHRIDDGEYTEALKVLELIEKRSLTLIKEIKTNGK